MTDLTRRYALRVPLPVELARQRSRLAASAELRNSSLFDGMPQTLLNRLGSSPRLSRRLYGILASEFGQPVLSSHEVRNFHLMPEQELEKAAFLLGLSYDLAMRGGAIKGEVLASIGTFCDAATLPKALQHAASVQIKFPVQNPGLPTQEACLANGWLLFRLWADAAGANSRWRICEEKTQAASLTSVRQDMASQLATVILADVRTEEEDAW